MQTIQDLLNAQGGCERIKNTSFLRQLSCFSRIFWRCSPMLTATRQNLAALPCC